MTAFHQDISASGAYTYAVSSPLGGYGSDWARDIAVDDAGNAYLTGEVSGWFPRSIR